MELKQVYHLIFLVLPFVGIRQLKAQDASAMLPDFNQLQRVETGEHLLEFHYDPLHRLTRLEVRSVSTTEVSEYTVFSYINGIPAKAELFSRKENTYWKHSEYQYLRDAQNRIISVVMGYDKEMAGFDFSDTMDCSYDSNGKIVSIQFRVEGVPPVKYEYDQSGNYIRSGIRKMEEGNLVETSYHYEYDHHKNPFSENGLGFLLFSLHMQDHFDLAQLLSVNNPTAACYRNKRTLTDTDNNLSVISELTGEKEFVNSLDDQGSLKQVTISYTDKFIENGTTYTHNKSERTQKFTFIKKQR